MVKRLIKRAFRPIRKVAKKIIPKEVRPFLPFIAAGIPGAQGLASLNAFMNPAAQKALFAGLTSAATDEQGDPLRAAALAAAPDVLSSGLGTVAQKYGAAGDAAEAITFTERVADIAGRTKQGIEGAGALKTIGAQTALDQSAKFAEIRQDEIDEYNKNLREQGVLDKTKRRTAIFNIYKNAGYDDDYVNSMLDRYGYDEGGIVKALRALRAKMRAPETVAKTSAKLRRKPEEDNDNNDMIIPPKKPKKDKGEEEPVPVVDANPDYARAMKDAMTGVEVAFGVPFGGVAPAEFKRFAKGGEVEEEVEESGIMIASSPNNFAELNMLAIDLFGRPYDQLTDGEQETLMDFIGSKSQAGREGIMQMASGYKSDIEEMYEQYVFEMEEMGLQPMSFSEFLARERAGMEDGGKVRRRKKGEPADEVIETEEEIFIDKMPKPKGQGIMEAADGGIMEKDMRGGGFIPEGSKERADDVPARLSKNEFVMTADAVRAAGGGSVNKGAKRMYDMMYSLEGKI